MQITATEGARRSSLMRSTALGLTAVLAVTAAVALTQPTSVAHADAPAVLSVAASADTYVDQGPASTRFGTADSLVSRGTPGGISYLSFAVPAAPTGTHLVSAKLRLRTNSQSYAGSAEAHVIQTVPDTWNETSTTWVTRPALSGSVLGSVPAGTVRNTTYDSTLDTAKVVALSGSRLSLSLHASGAGTDGLYVWSSNVANASYRPALVLTYGPAVASPAARTATGETVVNPDAAVDTSGWQAHWSSGGVNVSRTSLSNGPDGHSTALTVQRGTGTGSWSFALGDLNDPKNSFELGKIYQISGWVRDVTGSGQKLGFLLANGHYRHQPTTTSVFGAFTDTAWHKLSRKFACTAAADVDTGLYVQLPGSGAVNYQLTGLSVQEVQVTAPPKVEAPPSTVVSFAGSTGTAPSTSQWNYDLGSGIQGWGNGEQQAYTSSASNARVDGNGQLQIVARKELVTGTDGIVRNYSSARLTTKNKVTIQAGSYVEAPITAPTGTGPWSGFWLVGATGGTWPANGEIDVLEAVGKDPTLAHTALHMSKAGSPGTDLQYGWGDAGGTVDLGQPLSTAPHTYGVYFDSTTVRFYIDRKLVRALWADDAVKTGRTWPFGGPMFLVVNLAVGGYSSTPATSFPATLTMGNVSVWNGGIPF